MFLVRLEPVCFITYLLEIIFLNNLIIVGAVVQVIVNKVSEHEPDIVIKKKMELDIDQDVEISVSVIVRERKSKHKIAFQRNAHRLHLLVEDQHLGQEGSCLQKGIQ